MKTLSLFSGIGAASLAVEAHFGAEAVAFVELDKHCQKVLVRHNPGVPVFDDVRTVGAHKLPSFDILEAGFPCQDLSAAGKQAGLDGERSGLYSEVLRIAGECLPRWVFIENVPALLKYRGRIERDFERIGYGLTWAKVAAQHVKGCPHRRLRVFVLAELGGRHQGLCDAGQLPPLQAWPTPRATDDKDGRGKRSNRTPEAIARAGATLPESVQPQAWPTPAAQEPAALEEVGRPEDGEEPLGGCAPQDRRLSPLFVETLMGLPAGYTSTDGPPMREQALRLMASPRWPAPMVKGLWGDSPQFDHEPPRTVPRGWGARGERAARLRALGNCNPPAQYALALALIAQGPRQKGLFA